MQGPQGANRAGGRPPAPPLASPGRPRKQDDILHIEARERGDPAAHTGPGPHPQRAQDAIPGESDAGTRSGRRFWRFAGAGFSGGGVKNPTLCSSTSHLCPVPVQPRWGPTEKLEVFTPLCRKAVGGGGARDAPAGAENHEAAPGADSPGTVWTWHSDKYRARFSSYACVRPPLSLKMFGAGHLGGSVG